MWNRRQIDQLAGLSAWTYQGGRASAAEPAAWSALALAASGRLDAALAPANWLASLQQASGAVGVSESQETPRWPTSLATLAWRAVDLLTSTNLYADHIEYATEWILANHGKAGIQKPQIGHDTTLIGWSWAADTHSWLEPTCFAVLALKSVGLRNHPRTCEGVKLIFNRLLPSGAANYGNTVVLGQELLPHPQPTGIVMLALADESHSDPRVDTSLNFLKQEIGYPTGLTSLCFTIIGLTAHGRRPENVGRRLDECLARNDGDVPSAHHLALAILASQSDASWLPQGSDFGESAAEKVGSTKSPIDAFGPNGNHLAENAVVTT